MAAWYFDVGRGIPKATWRALDVVLGIAGILAIAGPLAGFGQLDQSWAIVAAFVLFIYFLLRLNYEAVARQEKYWREQVSWAMGHMHKNLKHDIWKGTIDRFKDRHTEGGKLLDAIREATDDDRLSLTQQVDEWVGNVERLLKDDADDLAYFRSETGVPSSAEGWRARLYEWVYIRIDRLSKLWDKAIGSREK